jgi:plastocyanin
MPDELRGSNLSGADDGARRTANGRVGAALLAAFAAVLALVAIDVLVIDGAQQAPARPIVNVVKVTGGAQAEPTVELSVSPGIKPGPDGKLHDAFSVTNFTVQAGKPVKLVINNTDTSDHSITALGAGVNIVVRPGLHTYTLLLHKQGRFEWICTFPCDPYSMTHDGYMRGFITSV